MRSTTRSAVSLLAAAAILSALPAVFAHGDDHAAMDADMDMSVPDPKPDPDSYLPTYFSHPEHRGLIFAHVALMVLAWVVMLPIGKRKSRVQNV